MTTTLILLLLIGFQLWYTSSQKSEKIVHTGYLQIMFKDRRLARVIGAGLILLATIFFVLRFGIMSGISAAIVGLMGVGCLVVLLRPFHFVSSKAVALLYALFVILEIVI